MSLHHTFDFKPLLATNLASAGLAALGTLFEQVWPLILGLVGFAVSLYWTWRKNAQEYRHNEEKHQADIDSRKQKSTNE